MSEDRGGILASFEHVDAAVHTIEDLRAAGITELRAYAPYPDHHLEEALGYKASPVRVFTLVGGLSGAAAGFGLTTFASLDWPLVTGGKPILSEPAYVVIAFELTVLFGALATVIGLFINARIPKTAPMIIYDPEFSAGRYGVYVQPGGGRLDEARKIVQAHEPTEIREDPEGVGARG